MTQSTQQQSEPFYSRALVDVTSIVDTGSEKSFEVVFATENPVQRNGWDERFHEILSCKKENMRTGRLDGNAVPLLDNHDRYTGITKQMGTVVSYKITNGECRAKIQYSTQDKFAEIWKDIKAGIIRSISTGYNVYKYIREVVEGGLPNYRAIDWEPLEISLAPVPLDFKSKVRSDNEAHEIIIEDFSPVQNIRNAMEEQTTATVEQTETPATEQRSNNTAPPAPAPTPVNETQIRQEGVQAERQRIIDIQTAVRNAGLEDSVANDLVTRGIDINTARSEIINKLADKNTPNVRTATVATPGITLDEAEKIRNAMSDALLHRAQPGSIKLEDKAHDFKFMSMLDMARHCLELKGEKAGRYSPSEVIKRAISTTDYPLLLNSTVERAIRRTYEALPAEWKSIARQTSAKDFREKTGIAIDGKVTFEEIAEGGEYKHSLLITHDAAKIKLKTYGRMIKITRQAIINDDLSVFDKLPKLLAQGAANFQADKVWGLIINNAKTPDGAAIFHATHKNLAAAGAAISETTLNAARTALYRMKTPAGELMPIEAKYLVVPIELEMTAKKILSAVVASAVGDVNVFANAFQIMTSPRLLDANAWYLAANPATTEGLVYAYLEGEEGLYIEKEVNFNDDTVSTKARLDFDAAAWDYRGWYKNPGA